MNLWQTCNNRPLIFLGSSMGLHKLIDVCHELDITVHGVMDSDYYGNTELICGVPVIDSEESLKDPVKLAHYKDNYNFFCAVNWLPMTDHVTARNREKRQRLTALIDSLDLTCISLLHPKSAISRYCSIGKGVFIDCFVLIEGEVVIEDHVSVYAYTGVGHHSRLGRNTVIQRHVCISGKVTFEENVYIGTAAKILKGGCVIGAETFVHEGITLHRGTVPGEIVSQHATNMRRVTFDQPC